jgi:hypothetical protein
MRLFSDESNDLSVIAHRGIERDVSLSLSILSFRDYFENHFMISTLGLDAFFPPHGEEENSTLSIGLLY